MVAHTCLEITMLLEEEQLKWNFGYPRALRWAHWRHENEIATSLQPNNQQTVGLIRKL